MQIVFVLYEFVQHSFNQTKSQRKMIHVYHATWLVRIVHKEHLAQWWFSPYPNAFRSMKLYTSFPKR